MESAYSQRWPRLGPSLLKPALMAALLASVTIACAACIAWTTYRAEKEAFAREATLLAQQAAALVGLSIRERSMELRAVALILERWPTPEQGCAYVADLGRDADSRLSQLSLHDVRGNEICPKLSKTSGEHGGVERADLGRYMHGQLLSEIDSLPRGQGGGWIGVLSSTVRGPQSSAVSVAAMPVDPLELQRDVQSWLPAKAELLIRDHEGRVATDAHATHWPVTESEGASEETWWILEEFGLKTADEEAPRVFASAPVPNTRWVVGVNVPVQELRTGRNSAARLAVAAVALISLAQLLLVGGGYVAVLRPLNACAQWVRGSRTKRLPAWLLEASPAALREVLEHHIRARRENLEQRSETARLRRLVRKAGSLAPGGLWILNAEGRTSFVSENLAKLLGYEPAELLGRPLVTHLKKSTGNMATAKLSDQLVGGLNWTELEFVRKDGSTFPADVWADADLGAEARQTGLSVLVLDARRGHQLKATIERERDFYTSTVDSMPGIFCVLGRGGTVLRWNRKLETATGYDCADIRAMTAADFFSSEEHAYFEQRLRLAARDGACEAEGNILTKSGQRLPYCFAVSVALFDERPSFVVVGTDIGRRKSAEAEKENAQTQLREAQKLEAIGVLAAGVAHDFNNIVSVVLAQVRLLRASAGSGESTEDGLAVIEKAGMRAKRLVRQILSFAPKEPQQLVVQPVLPIVEEVRALLQTSLPQEVELTLAVCNSELLVCADATQLHRVFMNLCMNAFHALEERSGRIRLGLTEEVVPTDVAAARGLAPGRYVRVSVSDTGVGMDETTRSRIFTPFFTTKGSGQGTGLGLSVVRGIVATHMGAIDVQTSPGKGSTFHVYLPAVLPQEHEPAAGSDNSTGGTGKSASVLYVDDDELLGELVPVMLKRSGYDVQYEADPVRAVARVCADPTAFELVITDLQMPTLTGQELLHAVRQAAPGLPVVVCSGELAHDARAAATGAGASKVLTKQELLQLLDAIAHQQPDGALWRLLEPSETQVVALDA